MRSQYVHFNYLSDLSNITWLCKAHGKTNILPSARRPITLTSHFKK